ncbi:MAG: hypothetical protein AAGF92_08175 [Myxococcota bacterium]
MTRLIVAWILACSVASLGCGSGAGVSDGGAAAAGDGGGGQGGSAPPRSKSNVCPDLLLLGCSDPTAPSAPTLPPEADERAVSCEVRFRDDDGTCAQSCDPQTCSEGPAGITCSPGPDPGVSTTLTCEGADLDCTGDGTLEAECVIDADILVGPPDLPDGPIECESAGDCGLEGATCAAGFCDFSALVPTLNAMFFVVCPSGAPNERATCTAVTTDGDVECDKRETVTVPCVTAE